jgi:hypothetical protein
MTTTFRMVDPQFLNTRTGSLAGSAPKACFRRPAKAGALRGGFGFLRPGSSDCRNQLPFRRLLVGRALRKVGATNQDDLTRATRCLINPKLEIHGPRRKDQCLHLSRTKTALLQQRFMYTANRMFARRFEAYCQSFQCSLAYIVPNLRPIGFQSIRLECRYHLSGLQCLSS